MKAVTLSPLFFLNPALLARAGLYTFGVVGGLSYIGATATNDKYLLLGGPLLSGFSIVLLSTIAPLALPAAAVRTLSIAESISLYGGLAVFGGHVLYQYVLSSPPLHRVFQTNPLPVPKRSSCMRAWLSEGL